MTININVVLLHDQMVDKNQRRVCTSITVIDVHDIARSCRTYDVDTFFVAHPAQTLRKLTRVLQSHWENGFGSEYNPNRTEALEHLSVVANLDEAIHQIEAKTGKFPKLVATSARPGGIRTSLATLRENLPNEDRPLLIMFGTGWGMSQDLLDRAELFLDPICGPGEYNHLSVRSACAIILDRLRGK